MFKIVPLQTIEHMDTRIVVGIILLFVVSFFGYQWWRHTSKKTNPPLSTLTNATAPEQIAPSSASPPTKQNEYPVVAGQTEDELRMKEPLQDKKPASAQEPVTYEGHAPADFESNIRHPEQSFHQPSSPSQHPKMSQHDVESGRAVSHPSSPSPGEQGFSPEMAQNDGPLVGNVYAFDGMEQSGFADF
jgi:hypothetical protein